MDLPPIPDNRGPNDPAAEQIAERCAEVQAGWTPEEEARRRGKRRLSQIKSVHLWIAEPTVETQVFDPGL